MVISKHNHNVNDCFIETAHIDCHYALVTC